MTTTTLQRRLPLTVNSGGDVVNGQRTQHAQRILAILVFGLLNINRVVMHVCSCVCVCVCVGHDLWFVLTVNGPGVMSVTPAPVCLIDYCSSPRPAMSWRVAFVMLLLLENLLSLLCIAVAGTKSSSGDFDPNRYRLASSIKPKCAGSWVPGQRVARIPG